MHPPFTLGQIYKFIDVFNVLPFYLVILLEDLPNLNKILAHLIAVYYHFKNQKINLKYWTLIDIFGSIQQITG